MVGPVMVDGKCSSGATCHCLAEDCGGDEHDILFGWAGELGVGCDGVG